MSYALNTWSIAAMAATLVSGPIATRGRRSRQRCSGVVARMAAASAPPPEPGHVGGEPDRVAHDPHGGAGRVVDAGGDVEQRQVEAVGDQEHLDVEAEPVEAQLGEHH